MTAFARIVLFGLIGATGIVELPAEPAKPAVPSVALPVDLDYTTFEFSEQGEDHKIIVTQGPALIRFDELNEGYSVIYNPQTEYYIGLENRNYTYWEFSWPEVKSAVENSKRYAKRLQDVGSEGFLGDSPKPATKMPTNIANLAAAAASDSAGPDDSGFVWRPTQDHLKVAGLTCLRWTGESVTGEKVQAWCYEGHLPKVEAAIAQLRKISNPMALVPVRTVAPDFIYPVYAALEKGGVTPLLLNWGGDQERQQFRLIETKTRDAKASLFAVPKTFTKTTLVTMDGIIDSQPVSALRGSHTPPRVDHSAPPPPNPNP